ncbi:MAG: FG-GAP-like repeat-containing protein, partial [Chloroflexi bacterium]|nr:FG-GAP-like repeat-containing protein [Chloroflexota bacterium]
MSASGIEVFPRQTDASGAGAAWKLRLCTVSFGRGGDARPVECGAVRPNSNRVELERGALLEWFVNDERGIEQGWTIAAPPPGSREDPLWIGLDFVGLSLRIDDGGRSAVLVDREGETRLCYRGLTAIDATGRELDARLRSSPDGVGVCIDDRGALYPLDVDPVLTGPAWTKDGDQAGAQMGFSVSSAGDVNADGYSDVVVGASHYDNGQVDEGRAFLFLGSAAGLSLSPAWTRDGDQAGAVFGAAVAMAGDVNGDGYSDVIVGANGHDNGQSAEGRATVYLGSASGLSTGQAWTAEGDQAFVFFGYSAGTAGDVNGDGYSDVIVGAPFFDNGQADEGRAFVYLGSAAGLSASPAWSAESNQGLALLGISVATAGDVNGDGYSDVIVGAHLFDNGQSNEGRAFAYLGSATGLSTSPSWTREGDQADGGFGRSVATAGDLNGDGSSDVIVGALGFDNGQTDEGRAYA